MTTITHSNLRGRTKRSFSLQAVLVCVFLISVAYLFIGIQRLGGDLAEPPNEERHLRVRSLNDGFTLHLQLDPPLAIQFELYKEAVDATRFMHQLVSEHADGDCSIYRAEPVPEWWGSLDRPDAWFDGGRWGPPYALLQGQFQKPGPSPRIPNAGIDDHHIEMKRGMVGWAGGKGGPHFFIAMADHPEWKTSHVIWAHVVEADMSKLDDLLASRPKKTTVPKTPPIISNFVEPVTCTVSLDGARIGERSVLVQ